MSATTLTVANPFTDTVLESPDVKYYPAHLGEKIRFFTDPSEIETGALEQISNVASMPFVKPWVAVMPDVHWGMGATVGSVIPTVDAIIPAAVGVDIGCGMIAVRTPFYVQEITNQLRHLTDLRENIVRRIPLSPGRYNSDLTKTAQERVERLLRREPNVDYAQFAGNWTSQLGSLGGGNHFIEISYDEQDRVWAFLHSGSRGIGNKIAQHYIKLAKKLCKRWHQSLPDPDLAFLPVGEPEFTNYIRDMNWAQEFARLNREEMMDRVLMALADYVYDDWKRWDRVDEERINCHHNFTQREYHMGKEVWLTRKGAISARQGELGLIPGSMATASFIVEGKGNPLSFNSSPHGAGRRFSRKEARRRYTLDDFREQTKAVTCEVADAFIDEIPTAYKDINQVMKDAETLVEIRHTLTQLVNVKGT